MEVTYCFFSPIAISGLPVDETVSDIIDNNLNVPFLMIWNTIDQQEAPYLEVKDFNIGDYDNFCYWEPHFERYIGNKCDNNHFDDIV